MDRTYDTFSLIYQIAILFGNIKSISRLSHREYYMSEKVFVFVEKIWNWKGMTLVYFRSVLFRTTTMTTPLPWSSVHWLVQCTLEYHWTDRWTALADAIIQWSSSGNLMLIWNTLEDHWSHKYTGMPLEPHWLMLAPRGVPVAIQC